MQQKPPIELDVEQQKLLGSFNGMFVMFTFEQRHVRSEDRIEKATWMLLTFYAQLDLHVQSFKVKPHFQPICHITSQAKIEEGQEANVN